MAWELWIGVFCKHHLFLSLELWDTWSRDISLHQTRVEDLQVLDLKLINLFIFLKFDIIVFEL